MRNYFFVEPCHANAAKKRCAMHKYFLCHLLPVGQWQCLRQQGSFAELFFLVMMRNQNAVAAAAGSINVEVREGGFDLHKKH